MSTILIVDDEKTINDLVAINVQLVGHKTVQAASAAEALEIVKTNDVDLVFLDIMMPETDGFELLPQFTNRNIPVIFISARDSLKDKVKGLNLGADDYITKPFDTPELLARMEAVLRRTSHDSQDFCLGDVVVKKNQHLVLKNNIPVELTAKEYSLLNVLICNRNIALSRDKLLILAWGYSYEGETRTVDMHIQRLRRKLGWDSIIKTVFKYGYRLEC